MVWSWINPVLLSLADRAYINVLRHGCDLTFGLSSTNAITLLHQTFRVVFCNDHTASSSSGTSAWLATRTAGHTIHPGWRSRQGTRSMNATQCLKYCADLTPRSLLIMVTTTLVAGSKSMVSISLYQRTCSSSSQLPGSV